MIAAEDLHLLLRQKLGTPYYKNSSTSLFLGDAHDLLDRLPAELIDLTITSPPYNVGKEYEQPTAIDDYVQWCHTWISDIYRVTRPAGSFWLNLGYFTLPLRATAIPIAYLLWRQIPFYLLQEIIWNYGAGVACKKMFSPRNEKLLWYVKDAQQYTFNLDDVRDPNVKYPHQKKNGRLKCNPLGKNPTDVWQIPKVTSGAKRSSPERTPHPAQFPLALVDRIVKASSNRGDILLDPFVGSGTVAVSGMAAQRYVIGFDRERKYLDIAAQRLEAQRIHENATVSDNPERSNEVPKENTQS